MVLETSQLDRFAAATGTQRPGKRVFQTARQRTAHAGGELIDLIGAADGFYSPVDIDQPLPGKPSTLGAQRLELRQNSSRVWTEPAQGRQQFAHRTCAHGRDSVVTIILEGHWIVAIADVSERAQHEWSEGRGRMRVRPKC